MHRWVFSLHHNRDFCNLHCPEFRRFVDAKRDKSFIENSWWKKIPKGGVLKVTDENSPLFGKYIGCNFTGVAIRRCLQED